MKNYYRIVTDCFAGFRVQIKYWWLPFLWFQKWKYKNINTFENLIDARNWIDAGCPKDKIYKVCAACGHALPAEYFDTETLCYLCDSDTIDKKLKAMTQHKSQMTLQEITDAEYKDNLEKEVRESDEEREQLYEIITNQHKLIITAEKRGHDKAMQYLASNKKCSVCGGGMVLIRGKYPDTEKRHTCPTCTYERLEQIMEISSKEYGLGNKHG